jgi:hypothetical protein
MSRLPRVYYILCCAPVPPLPQLEHATAPFVLPFLLRLLYVDGRPSSDGDDVKE